MNGLQLFFTADEAAIMISEIVSHIYRIGHTDFHEIGQEVYYLLHGVTAHALGRDHGVMEKVCELCKKARRIGSVLLLQLIHIELCIMPAFLNSGCSIKQPNE